MKKLVFAAIIFIALLISGVFFLLKSGTQETKAGKNDDKALLHTTAMYVAAEGKVEAMPGMEIEVGADMIARIDKFFVNEGDRVEKGAVIVRLDNKDIQARFKAADAELAVAKARYEEVASGSREEEIKRAEAALEAAEADMELAKTNLERYEQLYKEDVISKALLDEKKGLFKVAKAKAREAEQGKRLLEKGPKQETLKIYKDAVSQAEATVEYYKRFLEKTIIKSPISGKVIRKYLEEGETAIPETPIAAVADVDRTRINTEVDETDIGRIQVGDPAEVTSDSYPGKVFKGEIQEIFDYVGQRKVKPNNPAKNLDMKVIQVKILLKEKTPFKLGMTVDVKIMPDRK
ncbi:MAG: efflux RND transporter periplasmic adaptor subunit [Deltaproteobacteria bacterium]|nr:efflux RND transporter periplasmic adaptor subunit [Deltaproteobacteria bacterium]